MLGCQRTIRILHISDLHERVALDWMGGDRRAQVRNGMAQRHRVLGKDSLRNCKSINRERRVELVCFTGDIADWGLKRGVRLATTRFSLILNALELTPKQLFIVPGNHDVNRTQDEHSWNEFRSLARESPQVVSNWLAGRNPPRGVEPEWREQVLARTRAFHEWLERILDALICCQSVQHHQNLVESASTCKEPVHATPVRLRAAGSFRQASSTRLEGSRARGNGTRSNYARLEFDSQSWFAWNNEQLLWSQLKAHSKSS